MARLTCGAFEEATPQDAEADGGTERAEAENDTHGKNGHALDGCNIFHRDLLQKTALRQNQKLRPALNQ